MPISSNAGNSTAICCESLGKRYKISRQARYQTLRDTLSEAVTAPFRKLSRGPARDAEQNHLWALRNLSFEVKHGEILGIIGRNGSGKSTLLKLLARITRATEGRVEVYGRVGTLLEVGAGFHPELSGRENIFLYGAILGMKRREIARKFDEIVEFAECGRMLDTAIKHYSSGMYMRLAFAVAAHLETEILLVDEVLAVGDAAFQKKCLGKIGEAAHAGRTVLFVSHNMLAVESLCTRAICLHEGAAVLEGSPGFVTGTYMKEWLPKYSETLYEDIRTAPGNEQIRLRRVQVRPQDGASGGQITVSTPIAVDLEYWKMDADARLDLAVQVQNEHGIVVLTTGKLGAQAAPAGLLRGTFYVPADLLNNGTYQLHGFVFMNGGTIATTWDDMATFEVLDTANESRGTYLDEWPGVVRPNLKWKTELIEPLPEKWNTR
ncbi:MAG TPA: ABC transporter ATP-binding protein [Terracidiphilus sp.]|nr:ABC transporter ATP-binding protein [Terracidiphilus sp.]